MSECVDPPEGLDVSAITTEAGLLGEIAREAEKIKQTMREGRLPSKDDIRLISFLAGEVRRRIESLTTAQMAELDAMRRKARMLETKRWIHELASETKALLDEFRNPKVGLSLSRFSQAEVRISQAYIRAKEEGWDDDMVALLKETDANLQNIKKLTRASISLPTF
ncbi:MAG: hypothetical protein HQL34_06320 [Alphaproteobacteria bacterium]|nr:hypothetical protein [Alphaproteobacteria bacterium]